MRTPKLLSAIGLTLALPVAAYAAAADFNNDGFDDLAIGVPAEDIGAITGAGAVNLLLGSAAGLTAAGDQFWHHDGAGIVDTAEASDQFGGALATGDFNDDGFADLAIVVPGESIGAAARAGAVQILLGSATGLNDVGNQFWSQDSAGILDVAETDDAFGAHLAVGDFNNDGFADLAIGAHQESVGALATVGVVQILFGSPRA